MPEVALPRLGLALRQPVEAPDLAVRVRLVAHHHDLLVARQPELACLCGVYGSLGCGGCVGDVGVSPCVEGWVQMVVVYGSSTCICLYMYIRAPPL